MPNTGPNPISEYISYDDFGWSLLTSLQLVTMDYWESIYNSVSRVLVNCVTSDTYLNMRLCHFQSSQAILLPWSDVELFWPSFLSLYEFFPCRWLLPKDRGTYFTSCLWSSWVLSTWLISSWLSCRFRTNKKLQRCRIRFLGWVEFFVLCIFG